MCKYVSGICETACMEAFRTIIFTCKINFFKYNSIKSFKFFKELIAVPVVVNFISRSNENRLSKHPKYVFSRYKAKGF